MGQIQKEAVPVANVSTRDDRVGVIWSLKDLLIVFATSGLLMITSDLLLLYIFGNGRAGSDIGQYLSAVIMMVFPIVWIRRKYGLSKKSLGIGTQSSDLFICTAILVALLYVAILQVTPWKYAAVNVPAVNENYSNLQAILLPLSIGGFASIVLAPIGEEIMMRGFLYGYLRVRLGIVKGLFLQAVIFSVLHFDFIYGHSITLILNRTLLGLILGLFYEKSKSLYPSIVFHGAINYFGFIAIVWK